MPSDNVDVVRRSFQAWNETGVEGSPRAAAEVIEATAVGEDEVLIIFSLHGEGGSSGVPVEQPMGCLIRITDSKGKPLAHVHEPRGRARSRRAFGLINSRFGLTT